MKNYVENTNALFRKMAYDQDNSLLYRNMIVEENLRLVAHVLKKYRPYTDDQYQAGCMGLIVAVDTFKEDTGVPFPNYACFCIEREIHKLYRRDMRLLENVFRDNMIYLDAYTEYQNGDAVDIQETIADVMAEEEFDEMIREHDLETLFNSIIIPSVEDIANRTQGQKTKIDTERWKTLELQYILEFAQIESQKARFNLSQMANMLGVSVQNIRNRHNRVIENMKKKCRERGYDID